MKKSCINYNELLYFTNWCIYIKKQQKQPSEKMHLKCCNVIEKHRTSVQIQPVFRHFIDL